jgi:glutamate racemase
VAKEDRHRRVQIDSRQISLMEISSQSLHAAGPIGVFDSSVGGLSVLRALHAELPAEQFVYVGDSGHAPYGERDDTHVLQRSHAIADYLVAQHRIKALVVACNTATASAIGQLRATYPDLPIVGIEPALKPANLHSKTRKVGVMATRGTLRSEKFNLLLDAFKDQCQFVLQPCDGLADAIEHAQTAKIDALCKTYIQSMGTFGGAPDQIDTLVLGCTHYPFVSTTLQLLAGESVRLLDAGAPVAQQTKRLLAKMELLAPHRDNAAGEQLASHTPTTYLTTGEHALLKQALQNWLTSNEPVTKITA